MHPKLKLVKEELTKHFFDFLMLFLAISLGFVVDNYRDETNAKKETTLLANDLLVDIGLDTMAIQTMVDQCKTRKQTLQQLYTLVKDNATQQDSLLYVYSACIKKRPWFERHMSTISMLVNAGSLDKFT